LADKKNGLNANRKDGGKSGPADIPTHIAVNSVKKAISEANYLII